MLAIKSAINETYNLLICVKFYGDPLPTGYLLLLEEQQALFIPIATHVFIAREDANE